jgi:hypothetical protein
MATVKKKTAPAKKKAVVTKGAWTPPWAKKETTAKKKVATYKKGGKK